VIYNHEASCPVILKYFKDYELSEEAVKVLIEFAGYSLTNFVWIQKALMLYGRGSNGKSVFINLLKVILGKDFVSGESLQNLETDKHRVANLYGKRLNAFPDLKDTPLQTNEVFNTLTGNDLELIGERKYQHAFSFRPTTKLLFSANKIPFAYSDNYAYYRRWMLIEFPKTFEKNKIDECILEKMTTEEEKSGFVKLMLEGLKRVMVNRKYSYDLGVKEIERQYLLNSDNVQIFEEEELRDTYDYEDPTTKGRVYKAYQNWCTENRLNPVKPKTFTRRMKKLGRKAFNTTIWDSFKRERFPVSYYGNAVVRRYQDSS
jgi:putative DNA primase/helicase